MAQAISKMETTQTAVEWLQNELLRLEMLDGYSMFKIFEKAKAMEKEQIIVSFYEGMKTNTFDPNMGRGVMYYNETYGS